jgi:hypothetical protein
MAPHDTNNQKEVRRHAGPLIGFAVILGVVLLLLIWWVGSEFSGPDPSEPSSTVDLPAGGAPATPSGDVPAADAPAN